MNLRREKRVSRHHAALWILRNEEKAIEFAQALRFDRPLPAGIPRRVRRYIRKNPAHYRALAWDSEPCDTTARSRMNIRRVLQPMMRQLKRMIRTPFDPNERVYSKHYFLEPQFSFADSENRISTGGHSDHGRRPARSININIP